MTDREATLKDIVAETGIPLNTVARIMAGRITRISANTRERMRVVHAAAERLGYRPHLGARAMRAGRHGRIALITGTDRRGSHLPRELLEGLQEAVEAAGIGLLAVRMSEERLVDPGYLPDVIASRGCDGVLINHLIRLPQELVERIASDRTPSLWINAPDALGGVAPDDRDAGRLAAQALIDAGHRRIAFVAGFPPAGMGHDSPEQRIAGARAACGRRLRVHAPGQLLTRAERGPFHDRILADRATRPTGVVCYSPNEAVDLLLAATRAGLRVPEDLSLIAIGEDGVVHALPFDLSMAVLPWRAVGRRAVERLLGGTPGGGMERLPCARRAGTTVAPPTAS